MYQCEMRQQMYNLQYNVNTQGGQKEKKMPIYGEG